MFDNYHTLKLSTEKPIEEIQQIISEHLSEIGTVKFLPNGTVRINTDRINKFTHEVIIEGWMKQINGGYTFHIDTRIKLTGLMWVLILAIVGLIMLIIPIIEKRNLETKIDTLFSDIRLQLKNPSK